ncbi:hypothetical protein K7X08_023194 [Anisodus acutangulus]|uniref:Uncharacterized protein n=1 Tax=Anisodus acutangulus TaxID=402998 RepID=A0A9Q1LI82_9SOLA|nr:hypothetical protein K7X08_023194 [Anisodus acutangulus]
MKKIDTTKEEKGEDSTNEEQENKIEESAVINLCISRDTGEKVVEEKKMYNSTVETVELEKSNAVQSSPKSCTREEVADDFEEFIVSPSSKKDNEERQLLQKASNDMEEEDLNAGETQEVITGSLEANFDEESIEFMNSNKQLEPLSKENGSPRKESDGKLTCCCCCLPVSETLLKVADVDPAEI